jgi:hypothetical protein
MRLKRLTSGSYCLGEAKKNNNGELLPLKKKFSTPLEWFISFFTLQLQVQIAHLRLPMLAVVFFLA